MKIKRFNENSEYQEIKSILDIARDEGLAVTNSISNAVVISRLDETEHLCSNSEFLEIVKNIYQRLDDLGYIFKPEESPHIEATPRNLGSYIGTEGDYCKYFYFEETSNVRTRLSRDNHFLVEDADPEKEIFSFTYIFTETLHDLWIYDLKPS